jgi:hypothetical protein
MATQNTTLSDINEIFVGFILAGNKWFDEAAKRHYHSRVAMAKPDEVLDAQGKSVAMAAEFLSWAKKNGYSSQVKNGGVWWTARAGSMSKAVGVPVDQRKNPTDILVCFTSGPANGFLGLSAKATKTKGDIGFKNPGIGTVDRNLKLQLADTYKQLLDKAIVDFNLPASAATRKSFIRANPKIKAETEIIGSNILMLLRGLLLIRLDKMKQIELKEYLISDWMDAEVLYPPYIKVTGQGNKAPYKAIVSDPINNPKLAALSKYPIKLMPLGNVAIGVKAGDKQIMKIRFKFESEKLASPIKLSGDPW